MNTIVIYKLNDKKLFNFISIKGHSNYKEKGKDIVCSAISSIVNGIINFLNKNYKKETEILIKEKELDPEIIINIKKGDEKLQWTIEIMLFQLENIEKKYNKNIKITEINN